MAANNRLLEKAKKNVANQRKINYANDDAMKYVIGALQ